MDLAEAVKPVIAISRIFGACSCRFFKSEEINVMYSSKKLFAYSLAVNAAIILFQGGTLWHFTNNVTRINAIDVSVWTSICAIYIANSITCVYTVYLRSKHVSEIFNRLNMFHIKVVSIQIHRLRTMKLMAYSATTLGTLSVIILFWSCLVLRFRDFSFDLSYILHIGALCMDTFMSQLHCLFFVSFVCIIGVMYLEFNETMMGMTQNCSDNSCNWKQHDVQLAIVRKLKRADNLLKDTAEYINDTHGFVNVMTVMLIFSECLYGVSHFTVIKHSTYSPLWLIHYTIHLLEFTIVCKFTTFQAQRTANSVHDLCLESEHPVVKEELEIFSLQLVHRPVQFSAYGFFNLDFSLLYSMVGFVTTYTVILLQFKYASSYKLESTCNCRAFNVTMNG